MSKRKLLLISSSNVAGYNYMEQPKPYIQNILQENNVKTVLFIPYAMKNHDDYTNKISNIFNEWGYKLQGIHTTPDQVATIKSAEAIFVGGGNTFALLKTLYEMNLIEAIRDRLLNDGIPYIGISAGTNIAANNIKTTNDMPVVYPPSFDALNLIPFNINVHYINKEPLSEHMGECRDYRILEFVEYNDLPVLGLREGSALYIQGYKMSLIGPFHLKLFIRGEESIEYSPGSDLSFLLGSNIMK